MATTKKAAKKPAVQLATQAALDKAHKLSAQVSAAVAAFNEANKGRGIRMSGTVKQTGTALAKGADAVKIGGKLIPLLILNEAGKSTGPRGFRLLFEHPDMPSEYAQWLFFL